MSREKSGKLGFRFFALLVLALGAVALEADLVHADQYQEIVACDNTFDSGTDGCASDAYICRTLCNTIDNCETCDPTFVGCFGDEVHTYSNCLGDVHFTLNMCSKARAAAADCRGSYDHCLTVAQTQEQLGDCMVTFFECNNASGLDQCQ